MFEYEKSGLGKERQVQGNDGKSPGRICRVCTAEEEEAEAEDLRAGGGLLEVGEVGGERWPLRRLDLDCIEGVVSVLLFVRAPSSDIACGFIAPPRDRDREMFSVWAVAI